MGKRERTSLPSSERSVPRAEDIRKQVSRILSSPAFETSERNKAFFSFVVKETVAGRAETLKGPLIARKVFDRGDDFDAAHDPVVRMEARKLRAALDNYYLRTGASDPIRIQISKGAYVPSFECNATPMSSFQGKADEPKIVVMPFESLAPDANQDYIAAGITEEITTALSHYERLHVFASSTARHLYQQGGAEFDIAHELDVRFLLHGSVRQSRSTFKVSVKLLDAASGMVLWSEHYRRHLTIEAVFDLQEEIAQAVAARIGGAFGVLANQIFSEVRRKTPPSLSAYGALLTYYNYTTSISFDNFRRTLAIVKAALEQEPEYGNLWSALAALYVDNFIAGFYPETAFPLEDAEAYARKGIDLDPENQSTHIALAYVFRIRDIPGGYAKAIELAHRLNPNNAYHIGVYGYLELLAGHWEHGCSLMQEASRLNPYHPGYFHVGLFLYHYAHHNYRQAYQNALNINLPGVCFDPLFRAAALGQSGHTAEAEADLNVLLQLRPDFPERAHELTGRLVKAEGQVEHLIRGLQKAGL